MAWRPSLITVTQRSPVDLLGGINCVVTVVAASTPHGIGTPPIVFAVSVNTRTPTAPCPLHVPRAARSAAIASLTMRRAAAGTSESNQTTGFCGPELLAAWAPNTLVAVSTSRADWYAYQRLCPCCALIRWRLPIIYSRCRDGGRQ